MNKEKADSNDTETSTSEESQHSVETGSPVSSPKDLDLNRSKLVLVPNLKWLIVLGLFLGTILFLRFGAASIEDAVPALDQAVRNALTMLIGGMVLPFVFFLWLSFFSDWGTTVFRRLAFLAYLIAQFGGGLFVAQCVEFDGDLYPVGIIWPGQAEDYNLAELKSSSTTIDLKTETPADFPQFLGPNRDGKIADTFLAYDWEEEPPKLKWKIPVGPGHSGFATRNGFAVTMEQRGDLELTSCYEIETGELIWAHGENQRHDSRLGKLGPRSTPTIFDGKVYSLGGNGTLVCLNGADGSLIWKKELFDEFGTSQEEEKNTVTWGRAASPLVFENKVVVPAGGPKDDPVSLVCYDRNTGEEIWRAGDVQISYASPILMPYFGRDASSQIIISVNESNVTAHDTRDGEVIWEVEQPGNSTQDASTSQPVLLPGSQFLLTKGYGGGGKLVQVQGRDKQLIWENNAVLKTKFTNAVYYRSYAFSLSDGRLECVDLRNGRRAWKSGKSYGHGQILLVGSEILVLAEKGYVALVRAWGGTEENDQRRGHVQFTSFQAIEGTTWNTMAMHGNLLLIRNSDEAACYEMPVRYEE